MRKYIVELRKEASLERCALDCTQNKGDNRMFPSLSSLIPWMVVPDMASFLLCQNWGIVGMAAELCAYHRRQSVRFVSFSLYSMSSREGQQGKAYTQSWKWKEESVAEDMSLPANQRQVVNSWDTWPINTFYLNNEKQERVAEQRAQMGFNRMNNECTHH